MSGQYAHGLAVAAEQPLDREAAARDAGSKRRGMKRNVLDLLMNRETQGCRDYRDNPRGTSSLVALKSWLEVSSLRSCTASYCRLYPAPRSTIAAAFSPDGSLLASTHGDHTVKLMCCRTGRCVRTLEGHRRTPWVVRFHPTNPSLLVSGSLDHEVRLWNVDTAQCIGCHEFGYVIASLSFHPDGKVLAISSGHKLFMWRYNERGTAGSPALALRCRHSLRAVHFHPGSQPVLLAAEVNASSSVATAPSTALTRLPDYALWCDTAAAVLSGASLAADMPPPLYRVPMFRAPAADALSLSPSSEPELASASVPPGWEAAAALMAAAVAVGGGGVAEGGYAANNSMTSATVATDQATVEMYGRQMAATAAAVAVQQGYPVDLFPGAFGAMLSGSRPIMAPSMAPAAMAVASAAGDEASGPQPMEEDPPAAATAPETLAASAAVSAAAAAAIAGQETPCTVRLRLWSLSSEPSSTEQLSSSSDTSTPATTTEPPSSDAPSTELRHSKVRLDIPHAVLCSEMGAHFSPCGRYLAACVACRPATVSSSCSSSSADASWTSRPEGVCWLRSDAGPPSKTAPAAGVGVGSGEGIAGVQPPSRMMYELRVYSVEEHSFGQVLAARAVRAAHCLTSIQFSPTSEHLMLAYGRRHVSLMHTVPAANEAIAIHTILEVYRVADMSIQRVVASAEDEVNVACFHPTVGGGIAYGTKEGRLRMLQHDRSNSSPDQLDIEDTPWL